MNKSEQLAKLLGIEAKTFKECQRGEIFTEECPLGYCPSLGCSLKEYEIYPNFESPENFVKLLECFGGIDKKAIIYSAIEKIKEDGKLKQVLQATDFKY